MRLAIALALTILAACSKPSRDKEIDRDALERLIHEHAIELEQVRIEPMGDHQARYVVTLSSSGTKQVACAEFPSTIPDELNAADIMYGVKPPDDRDPHEYVYAASLLRHDLADRDPDYVKITIHPRGDDTARYVIELRAQAPKVVYAEYPGKIVDEIKAAGVPYSIDQP